MGFGIGNLGNIIDDFTESLNQIFGGSTNSTGDKGQNPRGAAGISLFNPELQGTSPFFSERWAGNAVKPNSVRYGFAIVTLDEIKSDYKTDVKDVFYLDIAPQSISQKEIFATNI